MIKNIFNELDRDIIKNYELKFNTSSLPVNFNKYQLVDFHEIDEKKIKIINSIKYVDFTCSAFVVIESLCNQIYLHIGETEYVIKKSRIFLLYF